MPNAAGLFLDVSHTLNDSELCVRLLSNTGKAESFKIYWRLLIDFKDDILATGVIKELVFCSHHVLKYDDPLVQYFSAVKLAEGVMASNIITKLLKNEATKGLAVFALGETEENDTKIEVLTILLEDVDPSIRIIGARGIYGHGLEKINRAMISKMIYEAIKILEDVKTNPEVRVEAFGLLYLLEKYEVGLNIRSDILKGINVLIDILGDNEAHPIPRIEAALKLDELAKDNEYGRDWVNAIWKSDSIQQFLDDYSSDHPSSPIIAEYKAKKVNFFSELARWFGGRRRTYYSLIESLYSSLSAYSKYKNLDRDRAYFCDAHIKGEIDEDDLNYALREIGFRNANACFHYHSGRKSENFSYTSFLTSEDIHKVSECCKSHLNIGDESIAILNENNEKESIHSTSCPSVKAAYWS